MQTPTTAEFNTAIEVLKKYAERLNEQATHSVIQMPESRLGVDYAARIQSQTIGQIGQIETVAAQVKTGGTKFFNNRIKPISVMFNPRHALLLRQRRILCPRSGCGKDAECPRRVRPASPCPCPVHVREQATDRQCPQTVRVHVQSASAFSPCPDKCPCRWLRKSSLCPQAGHCPVRKMSTSLDAPCPHDMST